MMKGMSCLLLVTVVDGLVMKSGSSQKVLMATSKEKKRGLEVRGGFTQETAKRIGSIACMVYAVELAGAPDYWCEATGTRSDVETQSYMRIVGMALGQMGYVLGYASSATDLIGAQIVAYLAMGAQALWRMRKFGSVGSKIDATILGAMTAGGFGVLHGNIDASQYLYCIAAMGFMYGGLLLLNPSMFVKNDNFKLDYDSQKCARFLSAQILCCATTSLAVADGQSLAVAALRGLTVMLGLDLPIVLASLYKKGWSTSAADLADVLVIAGVLAIAATASPTIF